MSLLSFSLELANKASSWQEQVGGAVLGGFEAWMFRVAENRNSLNGVGKWLIAGLFLLEELAILSQGEENWPAAFCLGAGFVGGLLVSAGDPDDGF